MIHAQEIVAEAERRAGIVDPEAHLFRPLLDILVDSINTQAALSPMGEAITREELISRTFNRLDGLRWLRDYPEIAGEAVAAPVFLTGLPRSGTTYFQYLFDLDVRFRLVRTWEANTPSPPPGFDPDSAIRRLAEETQRRQEFISKDFAAMHLADAEGPEECHPFMEQAYAAAGFHNLLNVPAFFSHLVDSVDLSDAYRVHKRQLQLLQWRLPAQRWALKYPNHVLAMPEILTVYPDARFVMTHRDPVQTLASISKLTLTLRGMRTEEPPDPHEIGRQMLEFVQRHIDRILAFDDSPLSERVTHVDYYRLQPDPVSVMREVHASLEIDTPTSLEHAIRQWHRENPKGARGANPYALETFGLDADTVAEQFAPYMQRFQIPREADGLARAETGNEG